MPSAIALYPRAVDTAALYRGSCRAHALLTEASRTQRAINDMQQTVAMMIEAAARECDWALGDLEREAQVIEDMRAYGSDLVKAIDYEVAQFDIDTRNWEEERG